MSLAKLVAFGWTGLILVVTLMPVEPSALPETMLPTKWCVVCGERGTSDALLNIVLFMPLGWAPALVFSRARGRERTSWRPWTAALAIIIGLAVFSASIELSQALITGRFATLGDVVFNSLGGAVGVGLATAGWILLAPAPRMARALTLATGSAAGLIFLGTSLVFVPSFPDEAAYHGQWTADLRYMEAYEGQVLEASLGQMPLPAWRLDDPDQAVALFRAGAPLAATAIAGPAPVSLAPIVSVATEAEGEIVLLGADRTDLVLRIRYRANDFLLDRPDLRVRAALASVAPGDTMTLGMAGDGNPNSGYTLWLGRANGGGAAATSFGPLRHTVGEGWALLMHPEHTPAWLDQAFALVWVGGLLFLVGFWAPSWGLASAGATIALLGMLAGAWMNPLIALSGTELAAIAAGTLLGRVFHPRNNRGTRGHSRGVSHAAEPHPQAE